MTGETRTGILGGTFDPVHLGHRDVAVAARTALGLDTVLLIPSRVPPHRHRAPVASGPDRLAMVELAAAAEPGLEASDLELTSDGLSYTSRTLDTLTGGRNPSQFFFITGADAFAEISTWHDYPDVLDLSHFVVVSRPGHPTSQLKERHPALAHRMRHPAQAHRMRHPAQAHRMRHPAQANRMRNPAHVDGMPLPVVDPGRPADLSTAVWLVEAATRDISSSDIRMRRAAGLPIDDLVSPSVAAYVLEHRLYTDITPD